MVPMVTVLLHLAHARVAYLSAKARKYGVGLKYRIPFCQSEPSGATSALKTILQQKDAPVIEEEEQTLQEYIEHLWLAFSFRDEDRSRNTGLFPQIRGRDFMSIATQEEPFILKEHQVGLIPEGWVRFLDGFVPIVFYEGFSAEGGVAHPLEGDVSHKGWRYLHYSLYAHMKWYWSRVQWATADSQRGGTRGTTW